MERSRARELVAQARVARLATIGPQGRADLVPITFALVDDHLVTAVDHKPKRTTRLARLSNIAADPRVDVLVDHYDDADWSALWWVRVRGRARVVEQGSELDEAVEALVARYEQYVEQRPVGPVIVVEDLRWQGWSARG